MAYISSREIGNVALRPARLEVGHYDTLPPHRIVAVCYCKYGFDYQKHTGIFTNNFILKFLPKCSKADPYDKMVDGKHTAEVRLHPETGMNTAPDGLKERYRIPPKLLENIFRFGTALVGTVGNGSESEE